MCDRNTSFTRRRFLAAAGATAIAAKAHALASPARHNFRFAYAASPGELCIYAAHTTPWTPIQSIPSEAPVSLAIDPRTRTLHILHEVAEHRGLPCGYIESFQINHISGRLTPLSQQPLSLSAIHPRHMALSPDGKTLAVSIHGGAAYNLLPILEDGRPGRPFAIRKETGFNAALPSRPSAVVFSRKNNHIFALDAGVDALTVFRAEADLPVIKRHRLPGNSGPTHLCLHPDENHIFIASAGSCSIYALRYEPQTAAFAEPQSPLRDAFGGPIVFHAPTESLYAAGGGAIHVIQFDAFNEVLLPKQQLTLGTGREEPDIFQLSLSPDNETLYVATRTGILTLRVDCAAGILRTPERIAPPAQTIVFL